ncbi:hypothetical protein AcW1_007739 [Taiwanofungus camphoratus]|nr:hypothetical protein AcV7_009940 [Antrodia cinnamomea]KAI0953553.1 hypothetical protein AcW1_007739 [Antrodia cinnamomea]KAI0953555.1 hypothetical protein AcW1_007739 [Antrodia cinnamomea]
MSNSQNPSEYQNTEELVFSLNDLLEKLRLAITIESPVDLTPSFLVAILESILQSRLDISTDIRESRDFPSKVQAMKMFLGVLENDVIRMDVGLSEVDPRKLAAGEWDEVVFVGELLCWLGKVAGILPSTSANNLSRAAPAPFRTRGTHVERGGAVSPSTHSTITNTIHSNLSMTRSAQTESDTTVLSVASDPPTPLPELGLFNPIQPDTPRQSSSLPAHRTRPRCIHEVKDPSFILRPDQSLASDADGSFCSCPLDTVPPATSTSPPVRYSGWIDRVDDDSEIKSFEERRRSGRERLSPSHAQAKPDALYSGLSSTPRGPSTSNGPDRVLTRHNSPHQYTLALLNERAKLLAELASLKASAVRN